MRLSLIVAVAENGVIGRGNELPWRLAADLRRFKRLTMGHHLIVGRKTFASIGRPLPGRIMIVVSRGSPSLPPDVQLVGSLQQAIEVARTAGEEEAFVAGGGEIYRLAMPLAERLYLTRVHAHVEGDTMFPSFDPSDWCLVSREDHSPDESNQYPYSFEVFERA